MFASQTWCFAPITIIIILLSVFTFFVISCGKKGNEKLFLPLKHMSQLANRLTVNNLKSERINIAGTKNELKDLHNIHQDAIVLNYNLCSQFRLALKNICKYFICLVGNLSHSLMALCNQVFLNVLKCLYRVFDKMLEIVFNLLDI